jgi:hypothetical protein
MSLNTTIASPRTLVLATDRRLTNMDTRKIETERSTKLTVLYCADALALIAYNGVGRYGQRTPSDWLLELQERKSLATMPLRDVLQSIKKEAEERIGTMPVALDRRHTFVIAAWGKGRTWICVISNYEKSDGTLLAKPSCTFEIWAMPENPGSETRVLVTGAMQDFSREDGKRICRAASHAGAAPRDLKNLCVKVIQNTAEWRQRRGTVGTSVLWAIAERYKGVEAGLDLPGGTQIQEAPNLITPSALFTDIRIEAPRGEPLSLGKPVSLPESPCTACGTPVPLGYTQCGVCKTPSTWR